MNENLKETVNELKSEIDSLRPLDKETENRIQQKFRLDWNYHSNNIEGNSLTFGETKSFLLHGITADGKPLKDHLDIKGHNEVLLLLQDVIKDERPLTENFIREIHETILHEPYEKVAIIPDGKKTKRKINIGQYKTTENHVETVTGEIFYFASPEETPAKMNDLMDWYKNTIEKKSLHPAELAALFHYKFIRIHPFDDGNGRLARILMNLTLMKFGFPPVIIKTQKKDEYYRALQQADGGDENYFVDYITKLEIDSLELYLRGAKGENIEEDDDIDKTISLFKASLNNPELLESYRNISNQNRLFKNSLSPLIISLYDKLNKFTDLFSKNGVFYSFENTSVSLSNFEPAGKILHINEFVNKLEGLFSEQELFTNIKINFQWIGLKIAPHDGNIINYTLSIQFNKNKYILDDGLRQNAIFYDYRKDLSNEDLKDIIENAVNYVIKDIEKIKNEHTRH